MQLYLGFYFMKLYMFRAFVMPILRSNVTAYAADGITNFMLQFVILTAAYAVMLLLRMDMMNTRNMHSFLK
jgi:hypothetical protein